LRLPKQWVDSGMSRRVLPGVMDPAMVAANCTHNTGLIILHEQVAYPDPKLSWVQLPSQTSAEICQQAAVENCTILIKYLEQKGTKSPLTSQLGLCAFLSARNLLCESHHVHVHDRLSNAWHY
jgi:hypothetical protein